MVTLPKLMPGSISRIILPSVEASYSSQDGLIIILSAIINSLKYCFQLFAQSCFPTLGKDAGI